MEKQNKLIEFVREAHKDQVRKYTGESYFDAHLFPVAFMADGKVPFGFEIGLCHDIVEDTNITIGVLNYKLTEFGYSTADAWTVCYGVDDLTDRYTHESYPELNRKVRKMKEAERLSHILPTSQTVKYCDMINNLSSIVEHDRHFAPKYMAEMENLLMVMDKGDPTLYKEAANMLLRSKIQYETVFNLKLS